MRRNVKNITHNIVALILVVPALFMQSCSDEIEHANDLFAIGTVRVIEGQDYYFALDEGSKLYPKDTTAIEGYQVIDGQRAFVYFELLTPQIKGYEYSAKIKHIENILTKDIYFMSDEKEDSIGDDRINVSEIWAIDNYINITYQFYYSDNPDIKHMLNLIVREENVASADDAQDYIEMEFRHNAYNDTQNYSGNGVVSFKMDNINDLLQNKKGVIVRVNPLYGNEEYFTVDIKR